MNETDNFNSTLSDESDLTFFDVIQIYFYFYVYYLL